GSPRSSLPLTRVRTSSPARLILFYLRQRRLGLGQPEGHLHGAVHMDSRRQRHARLLKPLYLVVQRAETAVAVGPEWTHAQFLGQGEGLLVVGFSLCNLWGLTLCRDLAEEPQGVGFMAPFLMRPRELQGPLRLGIRLIQAAGQQIRLAQPDYPERMVEHEMHRDGLLDHLLQQRQGLGDPSGER